MIDVRDNWRILMLVVLVALATLALFGPLGASSTSPGFTDGNGTGGDTLATVTSGEDGTYEVELPEGEYNLSVDEFGYEAFETNVTVNESETTTVDVTLSDRETGTVSGTVTADGNASVGDVELAVIANATRETVRTISLDESGSYETDLPAGEYELRVNEVAFELSRTNITVEAGGTQTVDIGLTPRETGTVNGTVTADNETVSGVEIEFIDPERGEIVQTATSGDNGTFAVTLPAGRTHDVRVDAVAFELFEDSVTVTGDGNATVEVGLTPRETGTVAGTVTADDDALSGVEVSFTELGTQEIAASAATNASGSYETELPTGEYNLRIDNVAFEEFVVTVMVSEGETTTRDVSLTPRETGTVTGTVTDEDGNTLSGIPIEFIDKPEFRTLDVNTFPDPTNLQYGLDLSGGARIRGQLVGLTAENVGLESGQTAGLQGDIADELGIDPIDIRVRAGQDSVEVFDDNVTQGQFADALNAAGLEVSEGDIREGVTSVTRSGAVDTLTERVDQTGLSGADVFTTSGVGGENFIVAEVPGISLAELREIVSDPGRVQIVAGFPDNGSLNTTQVLTTDDFAGIQAAQPRETGTPPHVPVTLTDSAAQRYTNVMTEGGFTTNEGIGNCFFNEEQDDRPREGEHCLYTVVDGEYVYGASMSPGLAQTIRSGDFVERPAFQMQTGSFEQAQELEVNLRAGELPTEIDIASESFISPSLAQFFKPLALLTALIAWLAVSGVVYYWYRDVRVAVPMLVTAASEVFLLLGFAATVGLALDLSHIAGLIAVIGTGLDDLIIMADEILQRREDIQTGKVFQSRFRKAFWVIGMAAATTIIAMSPLAVLSLGDLQGFAIITIVGVLIGVAVTRPAYGDVLRKLMLDDVKRK